MGKVWKEEEDAIILDFVLKNGKHWDIIAGLLPHRTTTQISAHWEKCLDPSLVKGPFTPQEDEVILNFVKENGPHNWPLIKKFLPARSPKQCRERWWNHLSPNVSKKEWSSEEDDFIFKAVLRFGPKWSTIAKLIPGRTDNSIKNRFNSSILKRIYRDSSTGEISLKADAKNKNKQKQIESIQMTNNQQHITNNSSFDSQENNQGSTQLNFALQNSSSALLPSLGQKKAPFVLPMISKEEVSFSNQKDIIFSISNSYCPCKINNDIISTTDETVLSSPELLPEPGLSLDDLASSLCGSSSETNDISNEFKPEPGFCSSFPLGFEMQFPAESFLTPCLDDEMFEFNEILKQ